MQILRARVFVLSLVLAFSCSGGEREEARERLNLILISLDTCRSDRLSCYGYQRPTTPAIDTLAREGVVFLDCLANSTSTAPSHMSIFTGQYPSRHHLTVNGGATIPSHTLAGVLAEHGWKTAAFTGHGSVQAKFGHGLGFDVFESGLEEGPVRDGEEVHFTRNLPSVLPSAQEWLDDNQEEPFFLFVHGYDPHCPYWAPEDVREEFVRDYDGPMELRGRCGSSYFSGALRAGDERANLFYLNDMYDAELHAADQALGGFFKELRKRGLFEKTVVAFTSDHGEVLGNHGFVGHTSLWEEEMRIPLVMRFPNKRWAGTNRLDPVQQVDILPTVLSALGVPIPPGNQGTDLYSVLAGSGAPLSPERMRLCEVADSVSVRFGPRWKLAEGTRGGDRRGGIEGIYDLRSDPSEARNLIETEEGRERFEELKAHLAEWRVAQRAEEQRYGGRAGEFDPTDSEMLEALGYGGDESPADDEQR